MRSILNKYGYVIFGAVLVFSCLIYYLRTREKADAPSFSGNPSLAYFVDENTGEEKVLTADQVPPLAGKDGKGSVVMAAKFKAASESAAKTYYFVKYPVAVRDKVQGMAKDDLDRLNLLEKTRLVRAAAAGSQWMKATDPQADAVVTVPPAEKGEQRRPVFPSR